MSDDPNEVCAYCGETRADHLQPGGDPDNPTKGGDLCYWACGDDECCGHRYFTPKAKSGGAMSESIRSIVEAWATRAFVISSEGQREYLDDSLFPPLSELLEQLQRREAALVKERDEAIQLGRACADLLPVDSHQEFQVREIFYERFGPTEGVGPADEALQSVVKERDEARALLAKLACACVQANEPGEDPPAVSEVVLQVADKPWAPLDLRKLVTQFDVFQGTEQDHVLAARAAAGHRVCNCTDVPHWCTDSCPGGHHG